MWRQFFHGCFVEFRHFMFSTLPQKNDKPQANSSNYVKENASFFLKNLRPVSNLKYEEGFLNQDSTENVIKCMLRIFASNGLTNRL